MANQTIAETLAPPYLEERGLLSWILSTDHKRIGLMYLTSIVTFFILVGSVALLMRLELISPGKNVVDAHTYNVLFTLHGSTMVFFFIVPGISATLGNFLLPLMIGARDVAFPRLNLLSYWLYLAGTLIIAFGLLQPADTGWTYYTPYSIESGTSVITITTGIFVVGFSSCIGNAFYAEVHGVPSGNRWSRRGLLFR